MKHFTFSYNSVALDKAHNPKTNKQKIYKNQKIKQTKKKKTMANKLSNHITFIFLTYICSNYTRIFIKANYAETQSNKQWVNICYIQTTFNNQSHIVLVTTHTSLIHTIQMQKPI